MRFLDGAIQDEGIAFYLPSDLGSSRLKPVYLGELKVYPFSSAGKSHSEIVEPAMPFLGPVGLMHLTNYARRALDKISKPLSASSVHFIIL